MAVGLERRGTSTRGYSCGGCGDAASTSIGTSASSSSGRSRSIGAPRWLASLINPTCSPLGPCRNGNICYLSRAITKPIGIRHSHTQNVHDRPRWPGGSPRLLGFSLSAVSISAFQSPPLTATRGDPHPSNLKSTQQGQPSSRTPAAVRVSGTRANPRTYTTRATSRARTKEEERQPHISKLGNAPEQRGLPGKTTLHTACAVAVGVALACL